MLKIHIFLDHQNFYCLLGYYFFPDTYFLTLIWYIWHLSYYCKYPSSVAINKNLHFRFYITGTMPTSLKWQRTQKLATFLSLIAYIYAARLIVQTYGTVNYFQNNYFLWENFNRYQQGYSQCLHFTFTVLCKTLIEMTLINTAYTIDNDIMKSQRLKQKTVCEISILNIVS